MNIETTIPKAAPWIAAVLLTFTVGGPVWSAPGDSPAAREAKEHFDKGIALFASGRYETSLEAFEKSFALQPKAQVLFNIAMCQKALFRYAASIASFEAFLQAGGERIPPGHRAKAQAALAEMEALVSRVTFEQAPTGASLFLNNTLIGTFPLASPLLLDPGRHLVRLELDAFEPLQTAVTANSGAPVNIRAQLQRQGTQQPTPHLQLEAATASARPASRARLVGGIISTTIGLGLLIPGAIATARWVDDYRTMDSTLDWNEYSAAEERLPSERTFGLVGLTTGTVLVGLGVVLMILEFRNSKNSEAGQIGLAPGGVTLAF